MYDIITIVILAPYFKDVAIFPDFSEYLDIDSSSCRNYD